MLTPPFLRLTGQAWKLRLGALLMAVGIVGSIVTPTSWFRALVPDTSTWINLDFAATGIGLVSMIGMAYLIRCPKCGEKLLPYAAIGMPHPEGLRWFFSCRTCPACLFDPRGETRESSDATAG